MVVDALQASILVAIGNNFVKVYAIFWAVASQ